MKCKKLIEMEVKDTNLLGAELDYRVALNISSGSLKDPWKQYNPNSSSPSPLKKS